MGCTFYLRGLEHFGVQRALLVSVDVAPLLALDAAHVPDCDAERLVADRGVFLAVAGRKIFKI